jgi:hypothetical protein
MAEPLDAVRSGEVGNDVLDGADHYAYPTHERNVGPLWKAYIGGRVACHIHFVFRGLGEHQPTNLCADFQIFPYSREFHAKYVESAAFQFRAPEREVSCGDKHWIEHPVFVPVGELLDDSQAVKLRVARSLVGLRIVEDCPVTRRNFAEGIRTGERLAPILDREFDAGFVSGLSRASTVAKNELPSKLVEGASEAVHDITQHHSYAQSPVIGHRGDPQDVITRIRVELGSQLNLIALPVEDSINLAFESVAVLVRPLNFGSGATKVNGHD